MLSCVVGTVDGDRVWCGGARVGCREGSRVVLRSVGDKMTEGEERGGL
jgi:hypothetical protein